MGMQVVYHMTADSLILPGREDSGWGREAKASHGICSVVMHMRRYIPKCELSEQQENEGSWAK